MTDNLPQPEGHREDCPRCLLVIDEWRCPETPDGLCPRCGFDIRNTITIEDLTPEEKRERGANKEVADLCMMLSNWASGYIRVMDEQMDPDFSSPSDYINEVATMMAPYLARLSKLGYINEERKNWIRDAFFNNLDRIVVKVDELEYMKRLSGEWSEKDEEVKAYWKEKNELLGDARVPQISNS